MVSKLDALLMLPVPREGSEGNAQAENVTVSSVSCLPLTPAVLVLVLVVRE